MLGDCDLVYMAAHCRDHLPRKDQKISDKLPRRPSSGRLHDMHADKLPRRPSSGRLHDMHAAEAGKAVRSSPGWLRLARTSADNFN